MADTQGSLDILDISSDTIILKNGGGALVIKVSAVNFGLLSEMEQAAIIQSFAQMLNSLSFSIQIVIHSQRLDISSYLTLLDQAQKAQINPLLSGLIVTYKQFVQSTIKDNEVLDKQFYVVIPVSPLELGLGFSNMQDRIQKIKTILNPRKDQLSRQLNRVGLKTDQQTTNDLIKIFFDIYNQTGANSQLVKQPVAIEPVRLSTPQVVQNQAPQQPIPQQPTPQPPPTQPIYQPPAQSQPSIQVSQNRNSRNHPFVVEELI